MDLTLQHIVDNRVGLLAELNRRQGIDRDYARVDGADGQVGASVLPAAGRDAVTQWESVKLST